MVAQNVFHRASSHQIVDLWRFADRCNIPQNLPTNFHSYLIATMQQRNLPSLCALLFQHSHLFLICLVYTCNDSRKDLHRICRIPKNCQCEWLLNFCKLLLVSCEVFVLHGHAWIHWVAKSCTTTAYRWLFPDSQLSLRTLWSAVIKSPKYSIRGTAPPKSSARGSCNFGPLTDLAISVFREMSINTVFTRSSRLAGLRSKDVSCEELACESPCSGISSSTKLSLNSCSHSGISELARPESANNGSPRSLLGSFYLNLDFYWLGQYRVALIAHQP